MSEIQKRIAVIIAVKSGCRYARDEMSRDPWRGAEQCISKIAPHQYTCFCLEAAQAVLDELTGHEKKAGVSKT